MEYQVSNDPHDPVFYSACYIREPKRLWQAHQWHESVKTVRDFRLETTCLRCDGYQASLDHVLNQAYVPHWTIDPTCTNCDAPSTSNFSSLAYLEHDPLMPPKEEKEGRLSQGAIIGLAVAGGLCLMLVMAGSVMYFRGYRKSTGCFDWKRLRDRRGSIQLKETGAYSPDARKAYLTQERERSLAEQREAQRASQFYSSNRDVFDANFKDYTFGEGAEWGEETEAVFTR